MLIDKLNCFVDVVAAMEAFRVQRRASRILLLLRQQQRRQQGFLRAAQGAVWICS